MKTIFLVGCVPGFGWGASLLLLANGAFKEAGVSLLGNVVSVVILVVAAGMS